MSGLASERALGTSGRTIRTGVLGLATLTLAAGAHVAGGGTLPGPLVLTGLAAIVGVTAAAVTTRRCSWRRLAVVMTLEQLALHLAFAVAAPMPGMAVGTGPAGAAVDHAHMQTSLGLGGCMPSATMLAAHAVALALTVWLLARGEAWFWRAVHSLVRPPRGRTPRRRSTEVVVVGTRVPGPDSRARTVAPTRGPPERPVR